MPQHRRSFTPQYRVTAAHMVIDGQRRVAEVARQLNVDTSLLHTWVRDERWLMSQARSVTASGQMSLANSRFRSRSERIWSG
ncbi:transposase [Mycobacterium intracellulare]|uniref:transposase n=1 Tax=Mycobacterium intracellulare TaxID=1767 RepID=UPI0009FA8436